jgi:hypothetical protein
MLNLIFALLPVVIIGAVITHGVKAYLAATGTHAERLWATSKDSATWFFAKMQWIGGWVIIGASNLADLLGQDSVGVFIHDHVPPQWAGWALLAIAIITWTARYRSMVRA